MKNENRGVLPVLLCFSLFLLAGLALHILLPDREKSENENRYLQQLPKLSWKSLISDSFTKDFEDYITDQFPFRDRWLDLKSRAERLSGKTENNGVFFCREDTLISRFREPSEAEIEKEIEAVNRLGESTEIPVIFTLIPSAAEIWAERLPANADTADQKALIQRIYDAVTVSAVDTGSILAQHAGEPIYYRTDHHWTTLGAYYGYCAAAEALGLTPVPLENYSPRRVSDSFYGTVYSSSGVRWVRPDSIDIYVPEDGVTLIRYDRPEGTESPVYDLSRLEEKDQYSMFLGGNVSRLTIRTGHDGMRLLVLRDSYADCELPFFFAHCSEIHVLDLRYFRQSVSGYAAENGFDAILITYSLADFVSDTSVLLMGT